MAAAINKFNLHTHVLSEHPHSMSAFIGAESRAEQEAERLAIDALHAAEEARMAWDRLLVLKRSLGLAPVPSFETHERVTTSRSITDSVSSAAFMPAPQVAVEKPALSISTSEEQKLLVNNESPRSVVPSILSKTEPIPERKMLDTEPAPVQEPSPLADPVRTTRFVSVATPAATTTPSSIVTAPVPVADSTTRSVVSDILPLKDIEETQPLEEPIVPQRMVAQETPAASSEQPQVTTPTLSPIEKVAHLPVPVVTAPIPAPVATAPKAQTKRVQTAALAAPAPFTSRAAAPIQAPVELTPESDVLVQFFDAIGVDKMCGVEDKDLLAVEMEKSRMTQRRTQRRAPIPSTTPAIAPTAAAASSSQPPSEKSVEFNEVVTISPIPGRELSQVEVKHLSDRREIIRRVTNPDPFAGDTEELEPVFNCSSPSNPPPQVEERSGSLFACGANLENNSMIEIVEPEPAPTPSVAEHLEAARAAVAKEMVSQSTVSPPVVQTPMVESRPQEIETVVTEEFIEAGKCCGVPFGDTVSVTYQQRPYNKHY